MKYQRLDHINQIWFATADVFWSNFDFTLGVRIQSFVSQEVSKMALLKLVWITSTEMAWSGVVVLHVSI